MLSNIEKLDLKKFFNSIYFQLPCIQICTRQNKAIISESKQNKTQPKPNRSSFKPEVLLPLCHSLSSLRVVYSDLAKLFGADEAGSSAVFFGDKIY